MKEKFKKLICNIGIISICLFVCALETYASDKIKVLLNGGEILFDTSPKIINDYTVVPMRAIFEKLGYDVDWGEATQSIIATKGNDTIFMRINSTSMYYNDSVVTLDIAPLIVEDRTLVPIRAISEISGCDVEWDGVNKVVSIYDPNRDENILKNPYYNAINEVNQIRTFIEEGAYLAAMEVCKHTLNSYNLSEEDINIMNSLYNEANIKYTEYKNKRTNVVKNEANLTREAINNARDNLGIPASFFVDVYSGYWYWEAVGENVIYITFYDSATGEVLASCEDLYKDGSFEHKFIKYKPPITKEQAVQIVKDTCANIGVEFLYVVNVTEYRMDHFEDITGLDIPVYSVTFVGIVQGKSTQLHFRIGKEDGKIYSSGL